MSTCAFYLDTSSFILNLKSRRDRGFHVHKELCQYLQKLARRCVRSSSLPSESDYHDILRISIPDAKALSVDDFVSRSKLTPRLDACCKLKAEKERKDAKHSSLSLDQLVANNREEFSRQARAYVAHLFSVAAGLTRYTSDIVKGLGAFDLETLLMDTMEQAAYCFKNLFSSFRLRGVFKSEEESLYMEEYLSFIDEVRRTHPEIQQPKLLIADAIDFVSKQPALKSRIYLSRIFRLRCLCIDEPRYSFVPVRFGSTKTDDPTSMLFDVVAPIQSYLKNAVRGLDTLATDASIARLLELEMTFGDAGLSSTYCPWDGINHFDRVGIQDCINSHSTGGAKSPCVSMVILRVLASHPRRLRVPVPASHLRRLRVPIPASSVSSLHRVPPQLSGVVIQVGARISPSRPACTSIDKHHLFS